jgi:hypothetical protein
MVYQDTHIQQITNFPNHAKDSYITRIFNKSRKIFAAAVSEGLSMNFVQVLMRGGKFGDENLPLPNDTKPRDENNKVWPNADTQKFLEAQKLVCAPLLTISEFDQRVNLPCSIPIVEAKLRQDGESYDVQFYHEYLRQDISSEPGFGIDSYKFVLKIFGSHGEAQQNRVLDRMGIFGFTCEGMYYLVCMWY